MFAVVFVRWLCILCIFLCVFFFFKQKTAYEMRISDWSSDVCSSDLFRQSGELKPCLIAAYYIDKLTKGDPIYIIEPITHILEREARVHVFDDVHHRFDDLLIIAF